MFNCTFTFIINNSNALLPCENRRIGSKLGEHLFLNNNIFIITIFKRTRYINVAISATVHGAPSATGLSHLKHSSAAHTHTHSITVALVTHLHRPSRACALILKVSGKI